MKVAALQAAPALILCCQLSPYWFDVAQAGDDPTLAKSEKVFNTVAGVDCKTCHGEYAEGDLGVGPFIRGATEAAIRAAIDATNEMIIVRNVIEDEQIRAVAAYIGHLGSVQVVRTLAKRGRFIPTTFSVRPGTRLQLIIKNSSMTPNTFKSDNMAIDDWTIPGRSTASVEWQAPDAEGEFSLYCADCKLKDQFFHLNVDASADEFKGAVPASSVVADDSM